MKSTAFNSLPLVASALFLAATSPLSCVDAWMRGRTTKTTCHRRGDLQLGGPTVPQMIPQVYNVAL